MLPALHSLVAGFVRRTWLVALVAVLACSAFAARAVSAFTGAKITEPARDANNSATVAPRASRPVARDKTGTALVERNIFCSSCVPRPESEAGPANPAYSGEPAVLIATSVGRTPRATVRVVATEAQGSWGLGETIPRVGRITRIGHTAIDVADADGHTATLSLVEATGGRPDPATAAATAQTPSSTAPASPFADRIEKLGEMSYRVDRELVRELVMGTTQAKGVRALPVVKNGQVAGLRLAGVKPDSIAAAVGIKSNDIFDAIDGVKIKNAQQLLDLFTKLDSVSSVELSGTRAGKPLVLQMQLR